MTDAPWNKHIHYGGPASSITGQEDWICLESL